jgi:phage gp36-like protein
MFQESKINVEELEKAILEARGSDPLTTAKIEWLKAKWQNVRYRKMGEETTMMHAILFESTTPLHTAVLADNLSYFKTHYTYNAENIELFLTEACLCGSKNIAEYLLAELKVSYKDFTESLAYIAASMNTEWAKEVALLLAKQKLPMVLDVYRLADGPIVDEIAKIFKAEAKSLADVPSSTASEGVTNAWLPTYKTSTPSTPSSSSSSTDTISKPEGSKGSKLI